MRAIRLVAFDLDGTLTRGDTVCWVIARRLGAVAMFAVATHRSFVGPTPLPDLDARHYPDGDLAEIARAVVQA